MPVRSLPLRPRLPQRPGARDVAGLLVGDVVALEVGEITHLAPMVQSRVYLAPGTTYVQPGTTYMAPGTAYQDQPIYVNGQRYYRDCWWDWGRRRCELKPWW